MEIGKEIKQRKFQNNQYKALINIIYTNNWIRDSQNNIFKERGLLGQHYNVLKITKGRYPDPISPGEILEVLLDKRRDLTRLVDKLVKMGYLQRNICQSNKRKIDICITEKGIAVTKEIEKEIDNWLIQNINLSEKEAGALSSLLDKLRG